jgi:hypothetical protein
MFPYMFWYISVKPGHCLAEPLYPVNADSVRFPFAYRNVSFRELRKHSDISGSRTLYSTLKLRLTVPTPQTSRFCSTFRLRLDGITILINAWCDCEYFLRVPLQIQSLPSVSCLPSYFHTPFHVTLLPFVPIHFYLFCFSAVCCSSAYFVVISLLF